VVRKEEGADDPLVEYRLTQAEEKLVRHADRIFSLESAVSRMWGAVGLAIVIVPVVTAFAVRAMFK
jgi:hypothetical protein